MITAERVGNRIHVRFPYDPSLVTKAKAVPGASFSKTGGAHWSYALNMRVCRSLREQFGSDLAVGHELVEWAKHAVEQEKLLHHLAAASDTELLRVPEEAPVLAAAMAGRTYQRVGARYVATGRSVLIADQPGLGKTLEAIGGIIESGLRGPVLVVSLKTAMRVVWQAELLRWVPQHLATVTVMPEGRPKRESALAEYWAAAKQNPSQIHFLIVNPEMLRTARHKEDRASWYVHEYPELFEHPWSGVIIDESAHRQSSLASTTSVESKMSKFRVGARQLPIADGGVKIALSGTPMRGRPYKLWGTLNWLHPELFTSFWNWVGQYWRLEVNGYTGNRTEIGTLQHPDKLYSDVASIMLRRTKSEVLKDLPPKQYGGTPLVPGDPHSPVGVWLPMSPQQKKAYEAMVSNASVALDGGSLMANGVLAELTRLKQFANTHGKMEGGRFVPALPSNKFDAVVAMLAERGITGNPEDDEGDSQVVIGSQFTATIDLFADGLRQLGIEVAVLTGKTKDKERQRLIDEFQADGGPRVFLINTNAGGVAVTLDKADDLFILDETWIPDDQEQLEDRIHRASRIHQVTIYYLRSLGTVEESIAQLNIGADDLQKMLMDGHRGVDIARTLLGHGKIGAEK